MYIQLEGIFPEKWVNIWGETFVFVSKIIFNYNLSITAGRHSNTYSTPSLQEAFDNLESAIKAGTTVKLENQVCRKDYLA